MIGYYNDPTHGQHAPEPQEIQPPSEKHGGFEEWVQYFLDTTSDTLQAFVEFQKWGYSHGFDGEEIRDMWEECASIVYSEGGVIGNQLNNYIMKTEEIHEQLKAPIVVSWKPQAQIGKDKLLMVAYIDSRDVQNRLDKVVGFNNWQDEYSAHAGKLVCTLKLRIDGEWISKSDIGKDTQVEADKGAASDAFKRAAVKWGIGRYIYDIQKLYIPCKEYKGNNYPVDDKGKILYNSEKWSEYINENFETLVR